VNRLRIGFLIPSYHPGGASQMPVVMRTLVEMGVIVDIVRPIRHVLDLRRLPVEHDLYVLKKKNGLALSLAGALHARGAAIVNSYPTTVTLNDKIVTFRILQAAGVPTPASYAASKADQLAPLLDDGPIVVKPNAGSSGQGVRVVRTPAELAAACASADPIFAQRYHPPQGRDRKMYVIGERVFGVKKVFPARTEAEKHGEPFIPGPELRDLTLRTARALGIDLGGVDIIESEGQPYVVDASTMPGFKGVPDASRLLADYFRAAAERAARGGRAAALPADDDPERLRRLVAQGSVMDLVLHALSRIPATPEQLERVRRLLEEVAGAEPRTVP
jgi:ribosomal protein S6--L-glutamate ligase